jgi:hypothetical protein
MSVYVCQQFSIVIRREVTPWGAFDDFYVPDVLQATAVITNNVYGALMMHSNQVIEELLVKLVPEFFHQAFLS